MLRAVQLVGVVHVDPDDRHLGVGHRHHLVDQVGVGRRRRRTCRRRWCPARSTQTSGSTPSAIIVNSVLTPDNGSPLPSPTAIRLLTSASIVMSMKPLLLERRRQRLRRRLGDRVADHRELGAVDGGGRQRAPTSPPMRHRCRACRTPTSATPPSRARAPSTASSPVDAPARRQTSPARSRMPPVWLMGRRRRRRHRRRATRSDRASAETTLNSCCVAGVLAQHLVEDRECTMLAVAHDEAAVDDRVPAPRRARSAARPRSDRRARRRTMGPVSRQTARSPTAPGCEHADLAVAAEARRRRRAWPSPAPSAPCRRARRRAAWPAASPGGPPATARRCRPTTTRRHRGRPCTPAARSAHDRRDARRQDQVAARAVGHADAGRAEPARSRRRWASRSARPTCGRCTSRCARGTPSAGSRTWPSENASSSAFSAKWVCRRTSSRSASSAERTISCLGDAERAARRQRDAHHRPVGSVVMPGNGLLAWRRGSRRRRRRRRRAAAHRPSRSTTSSRASGGSACRARRRRRSRRDSRSPAPCGCR